MKCQEEFLDKKPFPSAQRKASAMDITPEKGAETRDKKAFKCDQCDSNIESGDGLKTHVAKSCDEIFDNTDELDCHENIQTFSIKINCCASSSNATNG